MLTLRPTLLDSDTLQCIACFSPKNTLGVVLIVPVTRALNVWGGWADKALQSCHLLGGRTSHLLKGNGIAEMSSKSRSKTFLDFSPSKFDKQFVSLPLSIIINTMRKDRVENKGTLFESILDYWCSPEMRKPNVRIRLTHCNTIQYHVTPFDIQSTAERSWPFVCSNTKFATVLKHNIGLSDSSIWNEGEFYISTFLRFVLQAYFYWWQHVCVGGNIFLWR